jgi:acyl carrier protein
MPENQLIHKTVDNFPDLLQRLSVEFGDTEAFTFSGSQKILSYRQLHKQASALAVGLAERYQSGERILLFFADSEKFIAAFFACLYAGMIAVPVSFPRKLQGSSAERLASIINDADIHCAISTLNGAEILKHTELTCSLQCLVLEDESEAQIDTESEIVPLSQASAWQQLTVRPDDVAFLQYTSGSTGTPKGVMISHKNLWVNSHSIHQACGHHKNSRAVIWLPHFHDMGLIGGLLQPIFGGFPCLMMSPLEFIRQPLRWLKNISSYGATTSGAPSFAYQLCLQKIKDQQIEQLDLRTWDLAFCGAEPINADILKRFAKKFEPAGFKESAFYSCYGMAETTLFLTGVNKGNGLTSRYLDREALSNNLAIENNNQESMEMVNCGRCLDEHHIEIVNPNTLEVCEDGAIGEIWARGPSIASGYWKKEAETQASFQARFNKGEQTFLRTGDLGFIESEDLFVTGRLKELIIINGANYIPTDLENTLIAAVPDLSHSTCAVFSSLSKGCEIVVAALEIDRKTTLTNYSSICEVLTAALATHHGLTLHELVILQKRGLPKTTSGKLQRVLCKQKYESNQLDTLWRSRQVEPEGLSADTVPLATKQVFSQDFLGNALAESIASLIGKELSVDVSTIDRNKEFASLGINSIQAVTIISELGEQLHTTLSPSLIYDYPTINQLTSYLDGSSVLPLPPTEKATVSATDDNEGIAIIGLGCRSPDVNDSHAFWSLLSEGKNTISNVPSQRWQNQHINDYETKGSFFSEIEGFDPAYFDISPREAKYIDPQQRLVLEVVQHALEDAGLSKEHIDGQQCAVYIGCSSSDYALLAGNQVSAYSGLGNAHSIIANRVSYYYNLKGPSVAVDTACSSSLVAIDHAVQSLKQGRAKLAIAGGVNLMLTPHLQKIFTEAAMLSPTGQCHTFDEQADGYSRGEGCGILLLKSLQAAQADGDKIYAVISSSSINQDGRSNGLTAPNGPSQEAVIRDALHHSRYSIDDVSYIEAHGTGTRLGDLIEFEALENVFKARKNTHVNLGSVKTNIGHLEAGAGVFGIIKVALMLHNKTLLPHLNYLNLSSDIKAIQKNLQVNTQYQPWPDQQPLVAGVSSFGFGGTNAHMILSAAPRVTPLSEKPQSTNILSIAVHHPAVLSPHIADIREQLSSLPNDQLSEFCRLYNTRRNQANYRVCVSGNNAKELISALNSPLEAVQTPKTHGKIAFMFPGQGTVQEDMGQELYANVAAFRNEIHACDRILRTLIQFDLNAIFDGSAKTSWIEHKLHAQLVCFSLSYALARTLQQCHIVADALVGHSLGEYAAAVIADVLTLKEALSLICKRGELIQTHALDGSMAVVFAADALVEKAIAQGYICVSIAAYNYPGLVTISGTEEHIAASIDYFQQAKVACRPIKVPFAFHSPCMQPVTAPLIEFIQREVSFKPPTIPIVANLSGDYQTEFSANYWAEQLLSPVKFQQCLDKLYTDNTRILIDLSADGSLSHFAKQQTQNDKVSVLSISKRSQVSQLFQILGSLWCEGFPIHWQALYKVEERGSLPIPLTHFNRSSYWLPLGPTANNNVIDNTSNHAAKNTNSDTSHSSSRIQRIEAMTNTHKQQIEYDIKDTVAMLLEVKSDELAMDTSFLEMGADSLVLLNIVNKIEDRYKVNIPTKSLFSDMNTLSAIIDYVAQESVVAMDEPDQKNASIQALPSPLAREMINSDENNDTVTDIIHQQLKLMELQLQTIKSIPSHPNNHQQKEASLPINHSLTKVAASNIEVTKTVASHSPHQAWFKKDLSKTPQSLLQQTHVDQLIDALNQKNASSKSLTQTYRSALADNRASAGFRLSIKELLYPIVGERSQDSRIWDKDGNEYLDFTMGFGTYLCGHTPTFIQEKLLEQLQLGIQIGPQTEMAGKVASLVCKLSKLDRAAFCNSGSEAVMTAIRLARAVTKRNKIVIFSGSYHGVFDGLLGRKNLSNEYHTLPIAAGTPESLVKDLMILDYGSDEALAVISAQAEDIAAVIIEPIQSRHPELQPKEFIQSLRELTQQKGIAFVFDEVITGFRLAPGGAQEFYGVQADIATYGKIVGGGMPIGIVAGIRKFIDPIDGGQWQYGDDSFPMTDLIFFAGTFSKHPLTMAASQSILEYIDTHQDTLYRELEEKTEYVAYQLNTLFKALDVPIEIVHAGSLFRFKYSGNYDLLFFHLLLRGIYIWEGRNCFIAESHTYAELRQFINAVEESILAMKAAGFCTNEKGLLGLPTYPACDAQQRFIQPFYNEKVGSLSGHIGCIIDFAQALDVPLLSKAWSLVVQRYDILQFTLNKSRHWQRREKPFQALEHRQTDAKLQAQVIDEICNTPFPGEDQAMIRAALLSLPAQSEQQCQSKLIIVAHHTVADGWSYAILLRELMAIYEALLNQQALVLSPASSYSAYLDYQDEKREQASLLYWQQEISRYQELTSLPIIDAEQERFTGTRIKANISLQDIDSLLKKHTSTLKITRFILFYTLFDAFLRNFWNQSELAIGISLADRGFSESDTTFGHCVKVLPLISKVDTRKPLSQLFKHSQQALSNAITQSDLPHTALRGKDAIIALDVTFNLEPHMPLDYLEKFSATLCSLPIKAVEFPLMVNILETQDALQIDLDYQYQYFSDAQANEILMAYVAFVKSILQQPHLPENLYDMLAVYKTVEEVA